MSLLRIITGLVLTILVSITGLNAQKATTKTVAIVIPEQANARIVFGVEKLSRSLVDAGYTVKKVHQSKLSKTAKPLIVVASKGDKLLGAYKVATSAKAAKEGFSINSTNGVTVI